MPLPFLAIEIPFDPRIVTLGGLMLTWHGLFTAIGILAGVQIALWFGRHHGYDEADAYTLALIGIPSGIMGARLLFVFEHWTYYSDTPLQILALTEGGISVWGAVIGGVLGPLLFAWWRGYDIPLGLDMGGVGLILGMAIGRLGDVVNGEHLAKATSLPWGVIYTDPDSPAYAHSLLVGAHHPATTYEMLGDLVILAAMLWLKAGPLKWRHGVTFTFFFAAYAVMRFFVSYLRVDSAETFVFHITWPQMVSLFGAVAMVPVAAILWRKGDARPTAPTPPAPPPGRVRVRR
ncbi:MAG: prolipoprotein diacylglyceryl transferase [Dehalococcoidia bacterium]|nr:MAG: prolipoprotein diacylglyceryl transferase [Dehalococcoidia bacterium]